MMYAMYKYEYVLIDNSISIIAQLDHHISQDVSLPLVLLIMQTAF